MPLISWPKRTPQDDATLVARVRAGDQDAMAAIYGRESAAVYRYALALSGNPNWADDAMQEAFIALATRAESFDAAQGSLGAWLAGVARHWLLAQWRAAHRHEPLDEHDGDDGPGVAATDAVLVRRQDIDALWTAVRALPWPFREALVLVDLQERPYEQAAAIAGVEINTLRSRLHRARARLAALLNEPAPATAGQAAGEVA
ncbi:RNA polymerase sigma factor [Piscinibacter terrae]|nr:RNA polymerase sigma factor [Albitalea terrae]